MIRKKLYLPYMVNKLKEYPNCTFNFDNYILPSNQTSLYYKELNLNISGGLRYSSRKIFNKKIDQCDVLNLLWSGYGYLSKQNRVIPSAGGYYPLKLFALKIDEFGIINEIKEYVPEKNIIIDVPLREDVIKLSEILDVSQVDFNSIQWCILWTAKIMPMISKYGMKGLHFISMEVGHSTQMIILRCIESEYKHLTIGGIKDDKIIKSILPEGRKFLPQYVMLL